MRRPNIITRVLSLAMVLAVSMSMFWSFNAPISAADSQNQGSGADTPLRDKGTNTAYIAEKSAQWTNENDYLAQLTLAVNGKEITGPLDAIICLDRSGSMDMNYIHESTGRHFASCPCLNQDHFYLRPLRNSDGSYLTVDAADAPTGKDEIKNNGDGTLTVYNAELDEWVVLSTKKEQLYYQFSSENTSIYGHNDYNANNSYELAPYHFEQVGNDFVRISKWDTTDVRKRTNDGVWDHADESKSCFDRWMEAKTAVSEFTKMLLNEHSENNVALVPFSIRDSTMVDYLKAPTNKAHSDWLIENHFFPGDVLPDAYNSKVPWTRNSNKIDTTLASLFTTHSTDYIYALSTAYNMLTERSAEAKAAKPAVVVFLSDGDPHSMTGTTTTPNSSGAGSKIVSFYNPYDHIKELRDAITTQPGSDWVSRLGNPPKSDPSVANTPTDFWNAVSGTWQRHDVNPSYLKTDGAKYTGAPGLGAEFIAVSYMVDNVNSNVLSNLATDPNMYIKITPENSTQTSLKDALLGVSIFPGGRNSVLRDVISKYFYVPVDETLNDGTMVLPDGTKKNLPEGVTIEGDIEHGQTIVWDIGNIFSYAPKNQPKITVPLVLRQQYRDVGQITYYPTNDDKNPEPSIYTPDICPDSPDTGAKLYYTNPHDESRYDTIGTPKLPINPSSVSDVVITMEKRDYDTNEALSGARFTLTMNDDSSFSENLTLGVSAVTLSSPGAYTLTETQSPAGANYLDIKPIQFTVNSDYTVTLTDNANGMAALTDSGAGFTLTIYNKEDTPPLPPGSGMIRLEKQDYDPHTVLSGAEFTLTMEGDDSFSSHISLGSADISLSTPGTTYVLTETASPGEDYPIIDPIRFHVDVDSVSLRGGDSMCKLTGDGGNGYTLVIYNKKDAPKPEEIIPPPDDILLSILKRDRDNGEALSGANFRLTKDDGSFETDFVMSSGKTVLNLGKGAEGNYILVETLAPAGYVRDSSPIRFHIDASSNLTLTGSGGIAQLGSGGTELVVYNKKTTDSGSDRPTSLTPDSPESDSNPSDTVVNLSGSDPSSSNFNPNDRQNYTPIGDQPAPLAQLPELDLIFDDSVPLSGLISGLPASLPIGLPITGGSGRILCYVTAFGLLMILGGAILGKKRDDE